MNLLIANAFVLMYWGCVLKNLCLNIKQKLKIGEISQVIEVL